MLVLDARLRIVATLTDTTDIDGYIDITHKATPLRWNRIPKWLPTLTGLRLNPLRLTGLKRQEMHGNATSKSLFFNMFYSNEWQVSTRPYEGIHLSETDLVVVEFSIHDIHTGLRSGTCPQPASPCSEMLDQPIGRSFKDVQRLMIDPYWSVSKLLWTSSFWHWIILAPSGQILY